MDLLYKTPTPFDERKSPNPFWRKGPEAYVDKGDETLPTKLGFLTDAAYHSRGCEVPTAFTVWSALYTLSSLLKREVWIKWGHDRLYTNFYGILLGTAGVVKKSTAILRSAAQMRKVATAFDDLQTLLTTTPDFRRDPQINVPLILSKRYMFYCGKLTMEALLDTMSPEKKEGIETVFMGKDEDGEWIRDKDGRAMRVEVPKTSEIAIASPEMSMLLGKQKYNEGLVNALLELYDPHDTYSTKTMGRGELVLRYMHTTLIAGSTVEGIKSSVAESAVGDGFISRSIICHEQDSQREFRFPVLIPDGPTPDQLVERLIWIAYNSHGEYSFTPEADEYINGWYKKYKRSMRKNIEKAGSRSRSDIMLYKLALLIRLQRYERNDHFIHLQDVEDAARIMAYTYKDFEATISEVVGQDYSMYMAKVRAYLEDSGEVQRFDMARHFPRIPMKFIDICIEQLADMDVLEIRRNDRIVTGTSKDRKEYYVWKGGDA